MRAKASGDLSESKYDTLEKIGVDYKGPFRTKSVHNYNGFIIFSDNNANMVHVVLIKDKKGVCQVLEQFYYDIIIKYNKERKIMQCNYDTIFNSDKVRRWLKHKFIQLNISQPYVHSMNGQVERYVCSVMDKANREMLRITMYYLVLG